VALGIPVYLPAYFVNILKVPRSPKTIERWVFTEEHSFSREFEPSKIGEYNSNGLGL